MDNDTWRRNLIDDLGRLAAQSQEHAEMVAELTRLRAALARAEATAERCRDQAAELVRLREERDMAEHVVRDVRQLCETAAAIAKAPAVRLVLAELGATIARMATAVERASEEARRGP